MYNQKKLAWFKRLVITGSCALLLLTGFGLGSFFSGKQVKQANQTVKSKPDNTRKQASDQLTTETVKDFLISYYTKKDLGENRNRYKPFVTNALYNELVSMEEEPVNQAYKGYTVNQVLQDATIYINEKDESAIGVVSYKNTQRMVIGSDDKALMDQSNQEAIKLSYTREGKKFVVNKLEHIMLSDPLTIKRNSYPNEEKNQTEQDNSQLGEGETNHGTDTKK